MGDDVSESAVLEGKTALVTGASAGLGRQFATALAAAGARV
ncbi:MAG: short-chain dehydrogenase, partial [Proteobacteria bacterium]|nr:short-chain dehydrogenase [Pseudomonadota bacterium]